jgi:hypothetical protein
VTIFDPDYDPLALVMMFMAGVLCGWILHRILAALEKEPTK